MRPGNRPGPRSPTASPHQRKGRGLWSTSRNRLPGRFGRRRLGDGEARARDCLGSSRVAPERGPGF